MKFDVEVFVDSEANTVYYKLKDEEVKKDFILADYSEDDSLIGVEVLNLKKFVKSHEINPMNLLFMNHMRDVKT